MPGAYLYGWDIAAGTWVKLQCNTDGKLIIDPSEIFEDPPTDGQAGKAPTSNWAFDHKADASAHHTRYSDAEAVAAFGNRTGTLTYGEITNYDVTNINVLYLNTATNNIILRGLSGGSDGHIILCIKTSSNNTVQVVNNASEPAAGDKIYTSSGTANYFTVGSRGGFVLIYKDSYWRVDRYLIGSYVDIIDTSPVYGHTSKAIASSWAYNHWGDPSAHHARYTDAEAMAAVGYNGTKYWSCPGIHFDSLTPATDDVTKSNDGYILANAGGIYLKAAVSLPHGATVTSVIVTGNTSAESKTWELYALKLSDRTKTQMAYNYIGYADNSIDGAVINNSSYAYFLRTSSLAALDEIWGASITYTI